MVFIFQDFGAAEGGRLPRCNQQNKYIEGPLAGQCRLEDIVNPDSEFRAILDLALSKAKSGIDLEGTEGKDAVQIKPQRVSLKLRISKSHLWLGKSYIIPIFVLKQMKHMICTCNMLKQRITLWISTTSWIYPNPWKMTKTNCQNWETFLPRECKASLPISGLVLDLL
jgi:hypothetical protein